MKSHSKVGSKRTLNFKSPQLLILFCIEPGHIWNVLITADPIVHGGVPVQAKKPTQNLNFELLKQQKGRVQTSRNTIQVA